VELKRGDIVTVALQGLFGDSRPALVVQADLFSGHPSVTILPVTTELLDVNLFRIALQPDPGNGLQAPSQLMIDKPQCVPRDAISGVVGKLDEAAMKQVNQALSTFLGLA
jgi:mRNA interferase MazF